jgi:hypothetical protein
LIKSHKQIQQPKKTKQKKSARKIEEKKPTPKQNIKMEDGKRTPLRKKNHKNCFNRASAFTSTIQVDVCKFHECLNSQRKQIAGAGTI